MRKIMLSISLALLSVCPIFSQDFHIGLSAGIAFPRMELAKYQLKGVHASLPFEAKITDNFPAWIEYKAEFYHDFDYFEIGLYFAKNTTGGRISSKDFSGNYSFDQHMSCVVFGPALKLRVIEFYKTRIFFSLGVGAEFLKTDILEEIELYANNKKITYLKVRNLMQGIHASLGLSADYKLSDRFSASLYLNYYISSYHDQKTRYYTFKHNEIRIKPQWNGARSGLTIFYTFPKKFD